MNSSLIRDILKGVNKIYFFFIFAVALAPFFVFAQSPTVNSFTASRATMRSGEMIGFSWDLSNAGGYSFVIYCGGAGIKIQHANGALFTCDQAETSTLVLDDARDLQMTNISGSSRVVRARITPKDGSGNDYAAAAREASFSVETEPMPIKAFTSSVTTTEPFVPITLTWSAPLLDKVNLKIECVNGVGATSTSYTTEYFMPCGRAIFASDLAPSSSMTIGFSNAHTSSQRVLLTLLPAIAAGVYDGGHVSVIDMTIASDVIPDPIVTSFTASSTVAASGAPVNISWVAQYASGINLQISCDALITASSSRNNGAVVPCGVYAFDEVLPPSGSLALGFTSSSTVNRAITVSAIPAKKIGGAYDAVRGQMFVFTVKPPGAASAPVLVSPVLPAPMPSLPLTPPPPLLSGTPPLETTALLPPPIKFVFTQNMSRGSRLLQVTRLQELLSRDKEIYPEGTVSGYFGLLTERAVQRFQKKHGIVASGSPATTGYGAVGPKTRAQLNAVQ